MLNAKIKTSPRTYHAHADTCFAEAANDANGNQTSGDGRTLTYTSYNKPLRIVKGTVTSDLSYDAGYNRIKKISNNNGQTTTTIYLGKGYEEVITSIGVVEYKYYIAAGGSTAVFTDRSNATNLVRYLHKDHIGSTDAITDGSGNRVTVECASFDPFGMRRPCDWSNSWLTSVHPITRGFTGHNMDDDVGLIDMNARMYDAKLGRFLQPDTYVQFPEHTQGFNRYTYVNNNPLSYTDPSGNFLKGLFKAAVKIHKDVFNGAKDFAKKYGATIITIAANYYLGPWAGNFVAGFINSGGNLRAGFRSMVTGAISAALFYGVGEAFGHDAYGIGKIFGHGIAGGVMQDIQGGKFSDGFWSAGFTQAMSPYITQWFPDSKGLRVTAAAVIGGTASVIGGGKFANGAVTGAFSRLYNDEAGSKKKDSGDGNKFKSRSKDANPDEFNKADIIADGIDRVVNAKDGKFSVYSSEIHKVGAPGMDVIKEGNSLQSDAGFPVGEVSGTYTASSSDSGSKFQFTSSSGDTITATSNSEGQIVVKGIPGIPGILYNGTYK